MKYYITYKTWNKKTDTIETIKHDFEKSFNSLISAPKRITLPNCPSPVSNSLEKVFYPTSETIFKACQAMMGKKIISEYNSNIVDNFKGPY